MNNISLLLLLLLLFININIISSYNNNPISSNILQPSPANDNKVQPSRHHYHAANDDIGGNNFHAAMNNNNHVNVKAKAGPVRRVPVSARAANDESNFNRSVNIATSSDLSAAMRRAVNNNMKVKMDPMEQMMMAREWCMKRTFEYVKQMKKRKEWWKDLEPIRMNNLKKDIKQRVINKETANALFHRLYGDPIVGIKDMLKTDVALSSVVGGIYAHTIHTAEFAAKNILMIEDNSTPSEDIAQFFEDGEIGIAVTTRLPDHGYFAVGKDSIEARKEFMKEYMNHAMFTCTIKNPQGKKVTFTVSSPRMYAAGLFNNPADSADETLPRDLRRENANPSIILRPRLPKHINITPILKKQFQDNLRTWMVIAANYVSFPWNSYNGADGTWTIDLSRIKEYGFHLLKVLSEWKHGEPYTKYSESAKFLRNNRNLLYCAEFVHVVLNLGYNVPLDHKTLKEMGLKDNEIKNIKEKLAHPKKYKWIKSRNNWPPRDKDGNVQRNFPNKQLDPDMLSGSDYLNQGAHIYLEWVPLKFFNDNETFQPLHKVLGVESNPFKKSAEKPWFFDPALVMPVAQPETLLHTSALLYSNADDEFVENAARPYRNDPTYQLFYHGNWKSVLYGLLAGAGGGVGTGNSNENNENLKQYETFLRQLSLPENVIKALLKLPLTDVDRKAIASATIKSVRLLLLRKSGLGTPKLVEKFSRMSERSLSEVPSSITSSAPKANKQSAMMQAMMKTLRKLVDNLESEDMKTRIASRYALIYGTREQGDGSTSIVPPHLYTMIARNFESQHRNYYPNLVQFEAIGIALHKSLIRKSTEAFGYNSEDPGFCKQHMKRDRSIIRQFFNKSTSSSPIVVIVGGGISGLMTAKRLATEGCHVMIVEARNRLGGRIHTEGHVDYGTTFLGPRDPLRNPLIQEAMVALSTKNINTFARSFRDVTHHFKDAISANVYSADVEKEYSNLEESFEKERYSLYRLFFKDGSLSSHITSKNKNILYRIWKKYIAPFGADSKNISYRTLLTNDARYRSLPWEQTSYIPHSRGSSLVIDWLEQHLRKEKNVRFMMETELDNIGHCGDDNVRTRYGHRIGKNKKYFYAADCTINLKDLKRKKNIKAKYDAVVFALPLGVIKKNLEKFLGPKFGTYAEGRMEILNRLQVGHICKVVIQLKADSSEKYKKFVFEPDSNNIDEQIWVYNEPRVKSVISFHSSGRLADKLSDMSHKQLKNYVVKRLKIQINDIEFVNATKWNKDEYSLGTHPYFGIGARLSDMQIASAPIRNRIYFVGDWVSRENYGTAVGAAIAGARLGKILSGTETNERTIMKQKLGKRGSSNTRLARLWFFRGNSETRDSQGRNIGNKDDVANILLRAGHLGISDDSYDLTSYSKRIYGWMPVTKDAKEGDFFKHLMSGQRLKGRVGNDIQAFHDAAKSSDGFVICRLWLNIFKQYGVCESRHCGMLKAEKLFIKSSENRGHYNGLDGQYYAFPPTAVRNKKSKWVKDWDKNTFNCITWPKQIGVRLDRLPHKQFRSLTKEQVKEFANSGRASHMAFLLADFKSAACQCYKRGRIKECNRCPTKLQKYCSGEPMSKYVRKKFKPRLDSSSSDNKPKPKTKPKPKMKPKPNVSNKPKPKNKPTRRNSAIGRASRN